jgi:hypothetical protein
MKKTIYQALPKRKIPEPELWQTAVETWLHHMEKNYVENILKRSIRQTENLEDAVIWLYENGYSSLLGLWGGTNVENGVHIDVGGSIKSHDYIQVFYPDWNTRVLKIPIIDVLGYLKNGKKQISVQLSLL